MFKRAPQGLMALDSLTPIQRILFGLLAGGAIFPIFFIGFVRPVMLPVAVQLACVSALMFVRWRLPEFRGSGVAFAASLLAFIAASAAAIVAA